MKKLIILFLILNFTTLVYAGGSREDASSVIETLTRNTSTSPHELRLEAEELNIPKSQVQRYVVKMRKINQDYQSGLLTRTQYIGLKRLTIERLK